MRLNLGLSVSSIAMRGHGGVAAPTADIFVFAGQSNAQTNFTTLAGVPAYITSDANVLMWNYDTSAFVTYGAGTNSLQPTTQVDSGGGVAGNWGPEAEFSYRWRLINPAKKAFLVKYAIGSTSLFPQVGVNNWSETEPQSQYFGRVQDSITAAKAAIVALGLTPVVRMISWMQGEADCGNATWDAAYPTNLPNVVAAMRTRWGDANTKIIIGRINPAWAANPNVRPAQVTVGDASPLNQWINTDAYALTNSHFNDVGCSQFGKDTFYAYANSQTEKVVNGTFTSVITPWTGQSRNNDTAVFAPDGTVLSISSGALSITNVALAGVASAIQQISGLTIGATYKVSATVTQTDNIARLAITTDAQGLGTDFGATGVSLYNSGNFSSPGTVDGSFVATATSHYLSLQNFSFANSGSVGFDSVSVLGP
jgi:hypothetical protein